MIPIPAARVSRAPLSAIALRRAAWALPVFLLAALVAGCGKEAPQQASAAAAPPPLAVRTLQVAPQRVPIVFTAVGQTEGAKQVDVRARVSGILQKRLYQEGDAVRAGAPLFQIDRAPFEIALAQAQAVLAQEKARGEQAAREAARLKPLADERAISRKEYEDTLSASQLSAAAQQAAAAQIRQAELNLSYTLVTAPVSGITGRAEHSEGTLITTDAAGSLLTTINQVDPIWVRFSVSESDLAKLPGGRLNRAAPIDVQLLLPDGSRYPGKGRLNFTATEIDNKLGTLQLRAEFDNPKQQLLPGQFVRVQIIAGAHDNVFVVPQTAVMQTEKGFLLFVLDAEGKAQLKNVKMGEWVGTDWTVLEGLSAGDRVVLDNLLKLRPGSAVTATNVADAKPADAKAAPAGALPPAAASKAAPATAPATK
jgi:membrane fusion protein (multidrug efflux system)